MLFQISKKIYSILLLVFTVIMVTGCAASKQPFQIDLEQELMKMEQTEKNSPISGIRTGIKRQGITSVDNSFECTDDGAYFMCNLEDGTYLLYMEHGDGNVIRKLCSRENCDHSGTGCDAWFPGAVNICYYNGYLYTVMDGVNLYRINLDGSNRTWILDGSTVDGEYSGSMTPTVWGGVFSYFMTWQEDGVTKADAYYYKLDGTMEKPEMMYSGYFGGNDGVEFVMNTFLDDQRNTGAYMYSWEPETNERTYLVDRTEYQYGYWGVDASYVLDGSEICRLYPDGTKEVLFDTYRHGNYRACFFPDCIVIVQVLSLDELSADAAMTMYFYGWNGEKLGHITWQDLEDWEIPTAMTICGETDDRIFLTSKANYEPEWYIDKSELGTDELWIHFLELK